MGTSYWGTATVSTERGPNFFGSGALAQTILRKFGVLSDYPLPPISRSKGSPADCFTGLVTT